MRALSIKQPYAELIASGRKKKEYRTWSRSCLGDLLIVASKTLHAAADDVDYDPAVLVFGKAVCVVEFYTVTGEQGDYAWHFRNPRRVEAVPVKGSASLYHVPDACIRYLDGSAVSAASRSPTSARDNRGMSRRRASGSDGSVGR